MNTILDHEIGKFNKNVKEINDEYNQAIQGLKSDDIHKLLHKHEDFISLKDILFVSLAFTSTAIISTIIFVNSILTNLDIEIKPLLKKHLPTLATIAAPIIGWLLPFLIYNKLFSKPQKPKL